MFRTALLSLVIVLSLGLSARAGAEESIRVGSFNIRYANEGDGPNAWRHRRAMVLGILRTADFWGVQEALPEQVRDIEQGCTEFKVLARSREADATKGEACPILYRADRWELDPAESGTFWLSDTPEVAGSKSWDSSLPRVCTFARFTARKKGADDGAPRALYVFNVHLDHRGEQARLEAAKLVAARILAAQPVKGADRVLQLSVDCGEVQARTIVAGIAADHAPESLPGRMICVVANLEPAKIRGILSQGMLLAAKGPQGLALLDPGPVPPGTPIG